MDLTNAVFTQHALDQIGERQITMDQARNILAQPEGVFQVREGRVVVQGMIGKFLLRVIVDTDRNPPEVVTAYRTSQIAKYRSQQ